jgi:hypothetical protein
LARRKSRLTKNIVFDPRLGSTGRYVDASTGRFVSAGTVQDALEEQITVATEKMQTIARALANQEISIAEWQVATRREMKLIHTQAAALSKGGWAQMSQADWGAVGRVSRNQYELLEKFAIQIETGEQKLRNLAGEVNGQFLRRVDLYAQAGNGTREQMNRRTAEQNGHTHEMRVLDPQAQHCDCCLAEAGRWELVGTLKPLGACDCRSRDRCHFEFGRELPDGTIERIG